MLKNKVIAFKGKNIPVYFLVKYIVKKIIKPKMELSSKNLKAFLLLAAKIKTIKTKIKRIIKIKQVINFIKSPIDYMKPYSI